MCYANLWEKKDNLWCCNIQRSAACMWHQQKQSVPDWWLSDPYVTLDLWPFDPKSIGHIFKLFVWSFMMVGVKSVKEKLRKQLCNINHFQISMHCDLDIRPSDPEIHRAHHRLMGEGGGGLCMKLQDDRCKGKQICNINHFQLSMHCDLDLLAPKSIGHCASHLQLMGSLCIKFHDDGCKEKATLRHNNFQLF